jgi:signal transduction histidine kinase
MMVLFATVVSVLLGSSYFLIYSIFVRDATRELDRRLLDTANPIVADLVSNPSEQDVFMLDLPNQYLELADASGKLLQYSKTLVRHRISIRTEDLSSRSPTFRTEQDKVLGRIRITSIPFVIGRTNVYLLLAVPTRDTDQMIVSFRRMLLTLFPVSLAVTALVAAWFVGKSLRPIVGLTEHATQLTESLINPSKSVMSKPLPVSNPHDELGRLSATINVLFRQVNSALAQLRQFASDASHELRTPLAILRGEAELVLSQDRNPEDYRAALRIIDAELVKLSRIVEALFTLSMADAGQLRLANDPLHLDDVLEEACEMAVPLARAKSITIKRDIQEGVPYEGDEVFLRQLFLIFLDNAVKYSPKHTTIHVALEQNDGRAGIAFHDRGMGISSEHLPHIFERFYRAAGPETSEARSGGLGLAIAQAIVRAQRGTIECTTQVGKGTCFTILLPLNSDNNHA